jgi:hypothetical protein
MSSKSKVAAKFLPHHQLLSDAETINFDAENKAGCKNHLAPLSDDSSNNDNDELGSPRDDIMSNSNDKVQLLSPKSMANNSNKESLNSQLNYERNFENLNLCVESIKG